MTTVSLHVCIYLTVYASGQLNFRDSTLHVEIFQGIQSIIQGGVTAASTKKQDQQMFPTYWSPQRQICSQICGWGFEKKDALEQALLKYTYSTPPSD